MNPTEKAILKKVIQNLDGCTRVGWSQGDINDWTDWAKKMRTTIQNNVPVLQGLTEVVDTGEHKSEKTKEDLLS
jgi:hypothetical protein